MILYPWKNGGVREPSPQKYEIPCFGEVNLLEAKSKYFNCNISTLSINFQISKQIFLSVLDIETIKKWLLGYLNDVGIDA